jgi:hypothetical protein
MKTQPFEKLLLGLLVVLACVAARAGVSDAAAAGSRPWPLAIEINLTSSFGEYRSGHLHAGLDIKTYGREGVPCRAVGDGYVSRMRASPSGYGKAVYLKLASGETAVYAHLAEFSPALEQALLEEQSRAGRYRVDVYHEPDRFPVAAGDIVGYTGRTGTSAPHLHFEIRDERENPINPLSHGWTLPDASAPTIHGVIFVPLAKHSIVEGVFRARQVTLGRVSPGRYLASDTLVIGGVIGIGAHIIDRLNSSSGRLAPYRVELTVDGVLLSSITFESFTYTHTGEVDLTYDMERVRRDRKHYLLLFHRRGETLWNRTFYNDGVIDTEVLPSMVGTRKNSYTAVIRTVDREGNVSTALLPFFVEGSARGRTASQQPDDDDFYVFEDLLGVAPSAVGAVWDGGAKGEYSGEDGSWHILTAEDVLADGDANIDFVSKDGATTHLLALRSGEPAVRRLTDLDVVVTVPDNSLYSDAFIHISRWNESVDTSVKQGELTLSASPIQVGPLSLSLRKSIQIRFGGVDLATGRVAIYQLDERKAEWQFRSSEVVGDTLVASIRAPGVYGVFLDEEPPKVSAGKVRSRQSYATGATMRELVIPIADIGSGVDDERCVVHVNGRKRIARWDGVLGKMFVPLEDAGKGAIELTVVAVDRVGNETRLVERIETSRDAE